jgi:hypothetical protein
VIVFTLFRGLRWNTGTDWYQYWQVFEYVSWSNIFSFDRGFGLMEPGYMFLNALVNSIFGYYTAFLLITNLFVQIVYARFALTNSKYPIYVFVLIMFSTQFFPVRIGIAVAFIMMGLYDFSGKHYLRISICVLLAMSMHKSAIVFLPAYCLIFWERKIPIRLAVLTSLCTLILVQIGKINNMLLPLVDMVGLLGDEEISSKFTHYMDYTERGVVTGMSNIFNSVIFIITFIPFGHIISKQKQMPQELIFEQKSMKNIKHRDINYYFIYNMYFIFVMLGIVFSSETMANLKRMQNYFMFAFPILFSLFIAYGKEKYPKIHFLFWGILMGYVMFRAYILFFTGYPESHFPYKSIFG